jgi:hypothetical protein
MNDLYHYFGADLAITNTGSLMPVDGTVKGQQRVLRRLLTNPGGYLWHLNYGAGLPAMVGSLTDIPAIKAVIQEQMLLESVVAQDPAPVITVAPIQSGVSVQISYVDATTKTAQVLNFNVNR